MGLQPEDDVPLDEVRALCLGDRGEWFCFYPLNEIIDYHNSEFGLCPSSGKWAGRSSLFPILRTAKD